MISSATLITSHSPISAAYGTNNLKTNLDIRSAMFDLPPLTYLDTPATGVSSCFVVSTSSLYSSGNPFVLGLDHTFEKI